MVRARQLSVFLVIAGFTHTLLCLAMLTIGVIMQRAALHLVLALADELLASFLWFPFCSCSISTVSLEDPGENK